MEMLFKYISGVFAAFAALLCPIIPLINAATAFIFIDFLSGIAASRAVAKREGRDWWFESHKAWRTIFKAGFVAVAIVMTWIIDHYMLVVCAALDGQVQMWTKFLVLQQTLHIICVDHRRLQGT